MSSSASESLIDRVDETDVQFAIRWATRALGGVLAAVLVAAVL